MDGMNPGLNLHVDLPQAVLTQIETNLREAVNAAFWDGFGWGLTAGLGGCVLLLLFVLIIWRMK